MALGLFILQKRRLRGDLTAFYKFLMRQSRGAALISSLTTDRTQRSRIKLSQGRFRLNIRKRFLT